MNRFSFILAGICCTAGIAVAELHDGLVEPFRDVFMGPNVGGRVAVLHAGEGDSVEKGKPLLFLDDRIERLELERRRMMRNDESELKAARERAKLLKEDLQATKDVFETTASISREELRRKVVEALLAEIEVGRLEQAEEREQAELDMARARLDQNHIIAPFSGILAEIRVDEGESVQGGEAVLRFVDVSEAYLVLNLPADLVSGLKRGEQVTLQFGSKRDIVKSGKVAFISPVVDPASGLRRVKMHFINDAPQVEPGRVGYWVRKDMPNE